MAASEVPLPMGSLHSNGGDSQAPVPQVAKVGDWSKLYLPTPRRRSLSGPYRVLGSLYSLAVVYKPPALATVTGNPGLCPHQHSTCNSSCLSPARQDKDFGGACAGILGLVVGIRVSTQAPRSLARDVQKRGLQKRGSQQRALLRLTQ